MSSQPLLRWSLDFLAALSLAVLWGSIAQTQFNLAALTELGAEIGLATRMHTTWQDLLGFAPLYALPVAAVLLIALPLASLSARALPRLRVLIFAAGAGLGWLLALLLVDALVPMPTLIAATRGWAGLLTLTAGVAAAGALFAMLNHKVPAQPAATSEPLQ